MIEAKTLIHIETDLDHPNGAGIPICSLPKKADGNATLIYASPDLLEACKAALVYPQPPLVEKALRAAIAKATT